MKHWYNSVVQVRLWECPEAAVTLNSTAVTGQYQRRTNKVKSVTAMDPQVSLARQDVWPAEQEAELRNGVRQELRLDCGTDTD